MKIFIRVDSSLDIGTGHVMRCISIAQAFNRFGYKATFICKNLDGNISEVILANGFEVHTLNYQGTSPSSSLFHSSWLCGSQIDDAEKVKEIIAPYANVIMIVDHYALDHEWEREIASFTSNIIVIDDLADRQHQCSYLIDHNMYNNYLSRYIKLVPADCKQLLGPKFAILRREFSTINKRVRSSIDNILIFFGGIDKAGWTYKVLEQLKDSKINKNITTIVGAKNPYRNAIKDICSQAGYTYILQTNEIEKLMVGADLAIGAVGTSTWERASVGLPSLVYAIAENQKQLAQDINNILTFYSDTTLKKLDIIKDLEKVFLDKDKFLKIQGNCFEKVNSTGADDIVKTILQSTKKNLRVTHG